MFLEDGEGHVHLHQHPHIGIIHHFDVGEQSRGDSSFPIPWNVVGGHAGKGVPEEKATVEVRFLRKTEQHTHAQSNNQKHSLDHSAAKIQKKDTDFRVTHFIVRFVRGVQI